MNNRPVFVYGTLRPGYHNHDWALKGRTVSEETATLNQAVMFDYGHFPFVSITHPEAATHQVQGVLVTIPDEHYQDVVKDLDMLEGYRAPGSNTNLYDRVEVEVTTRSGATVTAWTYVAAANREAVIGNLPIVESGDWADTSRIATR